MDRQTEINLIQEIMDWLNRNQPFWMKQSRIHQFLDIQAPNDLNVNRPLIFRRKPVVAAHVRNWLGKIRLSRAIFWAYPYF